MRQGIPFIYNNLLEFLLLYGSIFLLKEYSTQIESKKPYILDCGAHIGLAAIYFKSKYPYAKIVCFEPNPKNFVALKKNIQRRQFADNGITLIHAALRNKEGKTKFFVSPKSWEWGGTIFKKEGFDIITVRAVRLSRFITKVVDLLKIDTEGAELEILKDVLPKSNLVKKIIVETHFSDPERKDLLKKIFDEYQIKGFAIKYDFFKSFMNAFWYHQTYVLTNLQFPSRVSH